LKMASIKHSNLLKIWINPDEDTLFT
jgi:hypothetical protein